MAAQDSSSIGLARIAFVSAIISTLGWLLFVLGSTGGIDLSSAGDAWERLQLRSAAGSTGLIYGWGGVLGALFSTGYLFAFAHALKAAGPQRWLAFIVCFTGILLTMLGFMANSLAGAYYLLPAALEGSAELAASYEFAMDAAMDVFEAPWFFGSFLVYGLGIAWIAYDALRTGVGPIWLNIVGLAGGIAGLVWLRPFIAILQPLEAIGSMANIVLVTIWAIGLCLVLLRRVAQAA